MRGVFLLQSDFLFSRRSSLSCSDLGRGSTVEGQTTDVPGFLLFHFPFRRTRSRRSRRERPSNSSCDGIWFVLASCPDEAHSITPHHRTPHTRDTLKTGRDWPVMSGYRRSSSPVLQRLERLSSRPKVHSRFRYVQVALGGKK